MLDYFAFVVLIILIAVVIAAWVLVAMWPGQIARKRNHSQLCGRSRMTSS